MLAADWDWGNLTVAGAFLLGAVLATIACLRIVRAVAVLFDEGPRRRGLAPWRRPHTTDDEPPEDENPHSPQNAT